MVQPPPPVPQSGDTGILTNKEQFFKQRIYVLGQKSFCSSRRLFAACSLFFLRRILNQRNWHTQLATSSRRKELVSLPAALLFSYIYSHNQKKKFGSSDEGRNHPAGLKASRTWHNIWRGGSKEKIISWSSWKEEFYIYQEKYASYIRARLHTFLANKKTILGYTAIGKMNGEKKNLL